MDKHTEKDLARRQVKKQRGLQRKKARYNKEQKLYGSDSPIYYGKSGRKMDREFFKAVNIREQMIKQLEAVWKTEGISAMDKLLKCEDLEREAYDRILDLRALPEELQRHQLDCVCNDSHSIISTNFKEQATWYEMLATTFGACPATLKLSEDRDSSWYKWHKEVINYRLDFDSARIYQERCDTEYAVLEVPMDEIIEAWNKAGHPRVCLNSKILSMDYSDFMLFLSFMQQTNSTFDCRVCEINMAYIPALLDKWHWRPGWYIHTLKLHNVDQVYLNEGLVCSFMPDVICIEKAPMIDPDNY